MKVEWAPLKEILRPRVATDVEPASVYPIAGVFGFGRGVLIRDSIVGAQTGYKMLTRLRAGDVVYSKLKAFEGAIACVHQEADGYFVSPEFPVFEVDPAVSWRYLEHVLQGPEFSNRLAGASTGLGARRERVHPARFLELLVPLPSRPDQDRIAAHLRGLTVRVSATRSNLLLELAQREWLGDEVAVSDLVERVTRREQPTADDVYPMHGVKWYGEGLFIREVRMGSELTGAVYRIEPGDLVYNRLFAWKQSFALAAATGWASNEFPTFRVRSERVRPRVLLAALLSPSFTSAVNAASTGSTPTSRNRLKERDFLALPITVPRPAEQAAIEASLDVIDRIKPLARRVDELASAILPAARNEIFSAMR